MDPTLDDVDCCQPQHRQGLRVAGQAQAGRVGLGRGYAAAMFWQHAFAATTDLQPWSSWLVFGHSMGCDLGVVAALAFVFSPRIGLGLLAGATAIFIFVPTVAVLATLLLYLALEKISRSGLSLYDGLRAKPVDNVPAVIALSEAMPGPPSIPRGCPEL
jgi:hypothetical protein